MKLAQHLACRREIVKDSFQKAKGPDMALLSVYEAKGVENKTTDASVGQYILDICQICALVSSDWPRGRLLRRTHPLIGSKRRDTKEFESVQNRYPPATDSSGTGPRCGLAQPVRDKEVEIRKYHRR